MSIARRCRRLLGLVAALAILGCSDPMARFGKIRPGMTIAEAEAILGPGKVPAAGEIPKGIRESHPGEGVTFMDWSVASGDTSTTLHVIFEDGKVKEIPVVIKSVGRDPS